MSEFKGPRGSELSSPACSMHEADDAYMGYAGRDEIIALLDELLEAERAGARVLLESSQDPAARALTDLLHGIQRDEAHRCAMLHRQLESLGAAPSTQVGGFYAKAMAIVDLHERLTFVNRGQGWVVRKLREMLPRVRDDALYAKLDEMMRSHESNIALIDGMMR